MEDIGMPGIESPPLSPLIDRYRKPTEIGTAFAEACGRARLVGTQHSNANRNVPARFSLHGTVEPTEIAASLGDFPALTTLYTGVTPPVQLPCLGDVEPPGQKLLPLVASRCERQSIIDPARLEPDQR